MKSFKQFINEGPFKLDPAMPLEIPGLLPTLPKFEPPILEPYPDLEDGDDPPKYEYDPNAPVPDFTTPDDDNEPIFDPFRFEPWPFENDPNYEYPDKWRTPMWAPIRIPF